MISVCILTKNAAATLAATLESTRAFPEVVLLDNHSTDETLEISRKHLNVKVFSSNFTGFGPLRNYAATLATHDWILALDSDEVLTPLPSPLVLDPAAAYSFPRHNFYNGKRIKGCGWHPEWVARLYHRHTFRFSDAQVHESLQATKLTPLPCPILHTPYREVADFLSKMQHYSTLFAEQYRGKRTSSYGKAIGHGLFAFFKSYVLKRGFLDGKEGLTISLYNGHTAFYKYLKLLETCAK